MRFVNLAFCLLVTVCMAIMSSRAQAPAGATYEVYALSYGVFPGYGVSNLVAGADKDRKLDLQMMVWLLKGSGGRNVLVDSGCYHDRFVKTLGIKSYVKPSE